MYVWSRTFHKLELSMKSKEELKIYKADWYQQNKLKNPEDKRTFDLERRKFLRKSGIYKISWKECPYYYYGQSSDLGKRFTTHLNQLRRNEHGNRKLQNIFNKHGEPVFSVIILCKPSELDFFELQFISFAIGDRNNCNILIQCSPSKRGIKWSDETRRNSIMTRIKNGTSKLIYAYNAKTGQLVFESYTIAGIIEHLKLSKTCDGAICSVIGGKNKTYKGYHFSRVKKSVEQVLADVIPDNFKEPYKINRSKAMSGEGNPMYGVKRPDLSGDNSPMRKLIASGYIGHKSPKKVKIKVSEILKLYKEGKTSKEIALVAGCGNTNICLLLRQNGIRQGCGVHRKRKTIATEEGILSNG